MKRVTAAKWSPKSPVNDRAWQLAQLAALLAAKTTITIPLDGQENLSTHNRKVELGWALQEAELLLAGAERASRLVHAYELFPEEAFLAKETIRKRFRDHNWPGLTSWLSCETLLGEILKSLRSLSHFADLKPPISPEVVESLSPLKSQLWKSPDELVKGQKVKRYAARAILLSAHLFCRDEFQKRIEKTFP